jgi:hypothetical protein
LYQIGPGRSLQLFYVNDIAKDAGSSSCDLVKVHNFRILNPPLASMIEFVVLKKSLRGLIYPVVGHERIHSGIPITPEKRAISESD